MNRIIRILCLILALITIVPTVACAEGRDDGNSEASTGNSVNVTARTEDTGRDPSFTDDLPQLDFKGQTVKMIAYNGTAVADEFYSEGYNKEPINDAVYDRNLLVQDRLDIVLDVSLMAEPHTALENAVKGGDDTVCDVVSNSTLYTVASVQKGAYMNLNETEYIDTSKHYWSQTFNYIASFGSDNKQYLVTGEMAMSLFRYLFVTIYNREQFDNKKLTDLYEVVENNEWTLDYQQRLIQDTYIDADGDGKSGTGDYFGFITGNCVSVDPYIIAAGIELVTKNDDGEWEYKETQENLDRLDELCNVVRRIYNDSNGTYYFANLMDDTGCPNIARMFTNKQGLMATVQLYGLETTAVNAEFLYGIVPMPKLTASQKSYATYVQDQVTSYGISATLTGKDRLDMASAFMECAASESHDTIVEAYYGKSLSYKYLQEENSVTMLNMIYDSIFFDFNSTFASVMTSFCLLLQARTMFTRKSGPSASSTLAKGAKGMKKSLERYNENMNGFTH